MSLRLAGERGMCTAAHLAYRHVLFDCSRLARAVQQGSIPDFSAVEADVSGQ